MTPCLVASDTNAKFHFGRLPDGRFYYVGNPIGGGRTPLVLSLSRDGMGFDRHFILGETPYERRRAGAAKGGQYGYVQPDPVVSGPVSVVRKIAALAEAHGVLFGPHHGKSGVGMMASLHMQCAAPNSGYLEYMYDPGFWNPEGFQAGFAQPYPIDKEGYIHAPTLPGLGIEWDRAFFKRHGLELG